MKPIQQLQWLYGDSVARRQARRLAQPVYPFAGAVPTLRRTTQRLGNAPFAQAYCNGLPENVFCRVGKDSVNWWILTNNMLWLAQVDRTNLNVAFAGCADFQIMLPENKRKMRQQVRGISTIAAPPVDWATRLEGLAIVTDEWMRRSKAAACLPGLLVVGNAVSDDIPPQGSLRSALRLHEPQRLEVAVPQILHALWSELRSENFQRSGEAADAWQMASVLMDNPWESWQTVRSGRPL